MSSVEVLAYAALLCFTTEQVFVVHCRCGDSFPSFSIPSCSLVFKFMDNSYWCVCVCLRG